jgi:hypothetical protein
MRGRRVGREQFTINQLSILPVPVNLTSSVDVGNIAALIKWGGYGFIVLDTLARPMIGADELGRTAPDDGIETRWGAADHVSQIA